jgi:hypothetical protein
MVSGQARFGIVFALGIAACSNHMPDGETGTSKQSIAAAPADQNDHAVFAIVHDQGVGCTGSLIAPNLILTARSCVADLSTGDGPVDCQKTTFGPTYTDLAVLNTFDYQLDGLNGAIGVQSVRVPDNTTLCGNDIALLILGGPVAGAGPILPRLDPKPQGGEAFTAVGYGYNFTQPMDAGPNPSWMRNIRSGLSVGCTGTCGGSRSTGTEWNANVNLCPGDGGSPALDKLGHQIGVASRPATNCMGGIYSALSSWIPLIVGAANDAAALGGYAPADWTTELPDAGTEQDGGVTDGNAGVGNGTGGALGQGGSAGASAAAGGNGTASGGTAGHATGGVAGHATSGTAGHATGAGGTAGHATGASGTAGHAAGGTGTANGGATDEMAGNGAGASAGVTTAGTTDEPRPNTETPTATTSIVHHAGCGCRLGPRSSSEAPVWRSLALCAAAMMWLRRRDRRGAGSSTSAVR